MRNSGPQLLTGAGVTLLTLLAFTGCTNGNTDAAGSLSTPPDSVSANPATASPAPADPGTTAAIKLVPAKQGDCAVDPASPGVVTFIVTADDETTPIELTYSAFQAGGGPVIRTTVSVGPTVMVLQSNCGNTTASSPWTFAATSTTGGSLSCATFYGGKLLTSASDYADGDVVRGTTVDCSAHPGM